jgi:hypothetical protein
MMNFYQECEGVVGGSDGYKCVGTGFLEREFSKNIGIYVTESPCLPGWKCTCPTPCIPEDCGAGS